MRSHIFIIDTNVLIAGLITAEPCSPTVKIVNAMLKGSVAYLLSPELLRGYREVLLRPKLSRAHGLNGQEIDQILSEIAANAVWREPSLDKSNPSPDPGDTHLWSLLASEPSAVLVTGDQLLIKNPKPQCSVISPATWVEIFKI
ncbi:MAG: putative toxin-antitoxin system toxin component, PIN family [Deltaproteobacteria bacterium]|uniref:Putative toxin-antitoxin system toxin component, PIN family n=1 Tax=Candidatus Desulfacyla euxinica TaxID=2841693 RepID=A0A8J6MYH5_9DELT|nr:putative toxin-antitoxin system toxin component, PIN family [Candidatus Desulfacyla euxinica]